ncbi:hypothetical protein BsIDN1_37170 [Bacillus safensis]|uniref:Uncharacterized protein n=1 Tax=Bacillus safensis TaxID=561879 RepID=A0A5S9MDS5_BACIA|nr:hypothetical protein BsIDN1_37170 [Bacillus safensis]
MFNEQSLPEEIQAMIKAKAKVLEEEFRPLIGTGGYESQGYFYHSRCHDCISTRKKRSFKGTDRLR